LNKPERDAKITTPLMSKKIDYSKLDQPQILTFVFYPRQDWSPPPPGAVDHAVPVEEGVSISCRFHPAGKDAPSILYFHGNGEVVYDYDDIAPIYNGIGANFFVADYRGYGQSTGKPSFSSTVADAHAIFDYFRDNLQAEGYTGPLFIMGRSLGSMSALELAAANAGQLKGLIIESGFASAGRLLSFLMPVFDPALVEEFQNLNLENIRSITIPALIIHGEYDEIIPYEQALIIHENIGSKDKRLVTIPGAGHNTILMLGMKQYFAAIEEFITG